TRRGASARRATTAPDQHAMAATGRGAPGGASPTEEASGGGGAPGGASPTGAGYVRSANPAEEASGDGKRVAIVHEKFTIYAGSEKVVEQMHLMWPEAPIYCSVCDPATLGGALADADVRTSALQRLYHGGDH